MSKLKPSKLVAINITTVLILSIVVIGTNSQAGFPGIQTLAWKAIVEDSRSPEIRKDLKLMNVRIIHNRKLLQQETKKFEEFKSAMSGTRRTPQDPEWTNEELYQFITSLHPDQRPHMDKAHQEFLSQYHRHQQKIKKRNETLTEVKEKLKTYGHLSKARQAAAKFELDRAQAEIEQSEAAIDRVKQDMGKLEEEWANLLYAQDDREAYPDQKQYELAVQDTRNAVRAAQDRLTVAQDTLRAQNEKKAAAEREVADAQAMTERVGVLDATLKGNPKASRERVRSERRRPRRGRESRSAKRKTEERAPATPPQSVGREEAPRAETSTPAAREHAHQSATLEEARLQDQAWRGKKPIPDYAKLPTKEEIDEIRKQANCKNCRKWWMLSAEERANMGLAAIKSHILSFVAEGPNRTYIAMMLDDHGKQAIIEQGIVNIEDANGSLQAAMEHRMRSCYSEFSSKATPFYGFSRLQSSSEQDFNRFLDDTGLATTPGR